MLAFTTAGTFAQSSNINTPNGQTTVSPDARAKDATDKINSIAQLSQDQYAKVLNVNRSFFAQSRSMAGGRNARLAEVRAQQLKSILTPDQFSKVQAAGL